jgi:hypothetical protein
MVMEWVAGSGGVTDEWRATEGWVGTVAERNTGLANLGEGFIALTVK